jgi:hypothetical protein
MARSKSKGKSRAASRPGRATKRRTVNARAARSKVTAAAPDAIALLKADHRKVAGWFEEFESTRSDKRKLDLARKICAALRVHTTIEAEIFYPAFLDATGDKDIHHEAEIEHEGAKNLIAQIEASGPEDDYYDAKVRVLSEMIKHHVKEEEQREGMFAQARSSDMDLKVLGEQLMARKQQLMGESESRMRPRRGEKAAFLHS